MTRLARNRSLTRRGFVVAGIGGLTLAIAGRAGADTASPLSVLVTTGMIADTVARVGGGDVEVKGLMGPGVDPHAYRQTRSDIVAMTRADLVLFHGLYLEAQMEDFFQDLSRRRTVRAVAEVIPKELLFEHPEYQGRFDPHVWMDPTLWMPVVDAIRDVLTEVRPDSADGFAERATALKDDLARLHTYAEEVLESVPPSARVLVTAHDAFGYFGRRYGFEVLGIQGISTESEAGLARIAELVNVMVDRQVAAVFVESSVSDRNVRALIEGAAARGHQVRVGGELFSDAMGVAGTYEGTYPGMIDHNVTTIAAALGGTVPSGGLHGKLAGI